MRFVLILTLFALLSSDSFAAPWDVVPLKDSHSASQAPLRHVQIQRGGSSKTPNTLNGLELSITATGLGDISALALGEDGTLYTADRKNGRIWSLSDRQQDGKIDFRRPLPVTFDAPSGLAIIDNVIYVADRSAIWSVKPGQEPKQLASLANAGSTGGPHILLTGQNSESLLLGLTAKTGGFRILELNKATGEARLISEGHVGALHSLAYRQGSDVWAASGSALAPIGSNALEFEAGHSINAIALPGQYEKPLNWPMQLNDHIIAAQTGPGAMRLIAIPTEFGQVGNVPRVLVEGFLNSSGRTAWGQPGPLLMDKRGLFFADANNGTLWRLSPKPKPQPKITIVDTASLPPSPQAEPDLSPQNKNFGIGSAIQGTKIDANSTIVQPSSIIYGSKLIKDYDEKKALEDAENAESEPKKKRRMSRKRKQPNE